MAKLNLSDVSKQFNIDRSTIYRAVKSGRLSRRSDGTFDLAEVIRCFGEPTTAQRSIDRMQVQPQSAMTDEASQKIIELLQKELERYKQREERLLDQIDRMQTLLEMKSQPVADAVAEQQSHATARDTGEKIAQDDEKQKENKNDVLHAVAMQQEESMASNDAVSQVQQQKRRGLFGRVMRAVFD